MKIENAKTLFFTDKQHYLNFRKAWTNAVNSPRAKSHLEPWDEWHKTKPITRGTGKIRIQGWITGAHVILYNLLREKQSHDGFTPITNKHRLLNGAYLTHGLYFATYELNDYCGMAKAILSNNSPFYYPHANDSVEKFLEPFEGTVTPEMLSMITTEKVNQICISFGGRKLIETIIYGGFVPKTFDNVFDKIVELNV